MKAGLQVWTDDGRIMLDTSTRVGRIIGLLQFDGTGFIDVPRNPGDRVFFSLLVTGTAVASASVVNAANPTVDDPNGGRITYSLQHGSGACFLLYGVY